MVDIQKEEDFESWVEFREGCPRRKGQVCWNRNLFTCNLDTKNRCDLWYAINFKRGKD